jgi:hypothetical protein
MDSKIANALMLRAQSIGSYSSSSASSSQYESQSIPFNLNLSDPEDQEE